MVKRWLAKRVAEVRDRQAPEPDSLIAQLTVAMGDSPVLQAMRDVPREIFVPADLRHRAYENVSLPIGHNQTISQPTMVARMTLAMMLRGDEHVLEVGAGSGYQAAILGALLPHGDVVAVERIPELVEMARQNLESCGVDNVEVVAASDTLGAPEHGPYDAILVSAGAPAVPESLLAQLKPNGRLVIPVGDRHTQNLTLVRIVAGQPVVRELAECRFVPLVGRGAWSENFWSDLPPLPSGEG